MTADDSRSYRPESRGRTDTVRDRIELKEECWKVDAEVENERACSCEYIRSVLEEYSPIDDLLR